MKEDKAKVIVIPEPEVMPVPDLPHPPEGKAWRSKISGITYQGEIYIGYAVFKNGKFLKTPIQEKPEDFEMIDLNPEENG